MIGTCGRGDRAIRWTTTFSVLVLAGIAGAVSYRHMFVLVQRYGETSWTAALLPISVDGMIVVASLSLLLDSREGRRGGLLPWTLLVLGSLASLAANVAVAQPSEVGRIIAAWPSCALIGSYELLMRQIRRAAAQATSGAESAGLAAVPFQTDDADGDRSRDGDTAVGSFSESEPDDRPRGETAWGLRVPVGRCGVGRESQRRAWKWAVENRSPAGDLPSGKAIAERFERGERWGRLVKRAGMAGVLDA